MKIESSISIKNATLSFPSSIYNGLTLKEEVFKILRLKQRTKLLYDVIALKELNLEIRDGEKVGTSAVRLSREYRSSVFATHG